MLNVNGNYKTTTYVQTKNGNLGTLREGQAILDAHSEYEIITEAEYIARRKAKTQAILKANGF